jgi:hypothetical protein
MIANAGDGQPCGEFLHRLHVQRRRPVLVAVAGDVEDAMLAIGAEVQYLKLDQLADTAGGLAEHGNHGLVADADRRASNSWWPSQARGLVLAIQMHRARLSRIQARHRDHVGPTADLRARTLSEPLHAYSIPRAGRWRNARNLLLEAWDDFLLPEKW